MPELPEVETVLRGLEPYLKDATIKKVTLNRKNLRFDFPKGFISQLEGQQIIALNRRAKYLIFNLSNGANLLSHLGMSGNFTILDPKADKSDIKHLHVEFSILAKNGEFHTLIYTDPRRFGFMDIFESEENCKFLRDLGPEPLGNGFNAIALVKIFAKKRTPIKSALLDQKNVAGLGNIYVCEALWRAKIHPTTPINKLIDENNAPDERLEKLVQAVRNILQKAIKAGGSTLNDFHGATGEQGYFQHSFDVYGKQGEPCNAQNCNAIIERITQAGRSSFFCPKCQKVS
ncbi:MAG: bifunctional DNA-formamidopyrimidine glycosylase/DNA-(apurinic or apyrimidinic site) lyase [Devosiaceae bacterium]|nr:bifunctional DNA-formamidopyrimidine glycosylase/DNA-(apurinic or apyrimidinic site) lyase [Devosiaceae bacterium]